MRLLLGVVLSIAGLFAAGCEGGRTDLPNATLRVVHAAPSLGPVTFKRVRANATPLEYKSGAVFSFDVDTYTFNLEIIAPDGSVADTISIVHTLEEGTDYTLVLRDIGGQLEPRFIETPARTGSTPGTRIQLMHAASTVGAVDVFVGPEGFDLDSASPWGSLSFDQLIAPQILSSGNYEFVLTEAGNRANILLRSDPFSLGGTQNIFLLIADGANQDLAAMTLTIAEGAAIDIVDRDVQSGIRVINAVSDRSDIDVGIDLALTPPLIPALPFGTVSSQTLIPSGDQQLDVTPAGDPGVLEIEQDFTIDKGQAATWFISGVPGMLNANFLADDFRVIPGESKLRVFNGSPLNATVQVFVVPPGANLDTTPPTATLANSAASSNIRLAPGSYELTVRDSVDLTVLAGPLPITIGSDGYYGILLSDALSGSGVDVSYLYDFN